jgi:hypothetical protein
MPTSPTVQNTCALMPTALSRMRFIAFAQSSAVARSSNTNVNVGDESDGPTKNPGRWGRPSSREMVCTVPTIQAMFALSLRCWSLLGFATDDRVQARCSGALVSDPRRHFDVFGSKVAGRTDDASSMV